MSVADDGVPPRPVPPRPDQCCGSGCPRCVYDLYDEALAEWDRVVAARAPPLQGAPALASAGRSSGAEHARRNPGLAPNPLPELGERESPS